MGQSKASARLSRRFQSKGRRGQWIARKAADPKRSGHPQQAEEPLWMQRYRKENTRLKAELAALRARNEAQQQLISAKIAAKEEATRKAEQERIARENAAKEKAEQERIAAENAAKEEAARKAEQERIAAEN